MNRFLLLAIAAWLTLGAGGVRAEMIGDPSALPGPGQFEVGIRGGWIFGQDFRDRDVTVTSGGASYSVAARDMDITNDQSFMASLAYGVGDRFSVYAQLGVREGGRFHFSNWDGDSATWWSNEFKLKSVFTWALGAKARVFESPEGLGGLLAAQYLRYDDRETGDMDSQGHGTSINDFKADYWRADVAAVIYHKLGPVTPYAGLGYEHAELSISGRANLGTSYANHIDFGDIRNNNSLTALVGLSWRAGGNFSLTLQGTFISRNAVSLGVNWAF